MESGIDHERNQELEPGTDHARNQELETRTNHEQNQAGTRHILYIYMCVYVCIHVFPAVTRQDPGWNQAGTRNWRQEPELGTDHKWNQEVCEAREWHRLRFQRVTSLWFCFGLKLPPG